MKKILFAICATTVMFTSCKPEDKPAPTPTPTPTDSVVTLSGDISANRTLEASKKYVLKGFVCVT